MDFVRKRRFSIFSLWPIMERSQNWPDILGHRKNSELYILYTMYIKCISSGDLVIWPWATRVWNLHMYGKDVWTGVPLPKKRRSFLYIFEKKLHVSNTPPPGPAQVNVTTAYSPQTGLAWWCVSGRDASAVVCGYGISPSPGRISAGRASIRCDEAFENLSHTETSPVKIEHLSLSSSTELRQISFHDASQNWQLTRSRPKGVESILLFWHQAKKDRITSQHKMATYNIPHWGKG